MDATLVITILLSVGGSSVVASIIVGLFGRKHQTAETRATYAEAEIALSTDARAWTSTLIREVQDLRETIHSLEQRERLLIQAMVLAGVQIPELPTLRT